jgi:FKBP-type peptidyl-prolyl cis-trans isomerase 2
MRILIASLTLLSLASCTLTNKAIVNTDSGTTTTETTSGATVEKVTPTEVADGTYVTLNYTLRDGAADGKVLETTVYSVAESNGFTWKTETDYTPFSVMVGSQQLIPGFEKGLIGMKKGDKKTIEVPPELGYGTGPVLSTIPKFQIAPVFTMVQDKTIFADVLTETVSRDQLPEDMKAGSVGQVFTGANNATAKVIKATDADITLEIQNTNNPFYKKKVAVWVTAESVDQGATYKITKIVGTGVTIEVTNKNSPFYNKSFAVGETLDLPSGKVEIKEIKDEEVVIAQSHPMAGKTLFFDIEILDIK